MAEKRKRAIGVLTASAVIVLLCGIGIAIAWPLFALRFAAPGLHPSTSEPTAERHVLSAAGGSGASAPGLLLTAGATSGGVVASPGDASPRGSVVAPFPEE